MTNNPSDDALPESAPALLNIKQIRRVFLPLSDRTIYRMIAAGEFPKADIAIGAKIRLWRTETILEWIKANATGNE